MTVDVPLPKANMKLFRVMLEERAGCAYAVTDAPMVQLEMSGERCNCLGRRLIQLHLVHVSGGLCCDVLSQPFLSESHALLLACGWF